MSFFKTISSFFNPTTSSSSIPSFNKSNVNLSLNNNSSLQSTSSLNDSASRLPSTSNSASFNIPNSPALHPFPPPSQFPPLDLSWNRIKKWSKMRCPELVDTLNKPASILALDAFELHVGFQLPPAVRDYFLVHDGQELESDGDGLLFGLHLLPIDDVLEQYQFWRSVDDDQQINGNQYILSRMKSIPPGWIKTSYSNPAWLPLATDRMGNYIGVDLDPPEDSSGAIPGQVILFGRDIDTKIVVCNSDGSGGWGKFFSFFADLLENNQCSFSNDKYNENYSSSFDSIGDYLESSNKVGLKVGGDYLGWDTLESFFDRSLKHWLEIGLGPQSPPAIHLESPQGITKEISIPNHTNNDNNSKSKGKERALTEPIPSMNNYNEVDNINNEIKKSRLMSISTSENGRRYKKSSTLNLPPVTPIDLPTQKISQKWTKRRRLNSLPSTIVNISLQFPANRGWDTMRQPHVPEQAVVSLLVKDQLAVATKAGIDFAVTVEIGGKVPGTVVVVKVENGTLADVDEETDIFTASIRKLRLAMSSGDSKFREG